MEYWSDGVLWNWIRNPLLHYSTTPLKHFFLAELSQKSQIILEK